MSLDGNAPKKEYTAVEAWRMASNNEAATKKIEVFAGNSLATIAFAYNPTATQADGDEILALLVSHPKVFKAEITTHSHKVDDPLPAGETVQFEVRSGLTYRAAPPEPE